MWVPFIPAPFRSGPHFLRVCGVKFGNPGMGFSTFSCHVYMQNGTRVQLTGFPAYCSLPVVPETVLFYPTSSDFILPSGCLLVHLSDVFRCTRSNTNTYFRCTFLGHVALLSGDHGILHSKRLPGMDFWGHPRPLPPALLTRTGTFLAGGDTTEGGGLADWGSGIGTLSVYVGDLDVSRVSLRNWCAL